MSKINLYRQKFYRLTESKLGDVKPLINEQYSWANSGTQTSAKTTKAEPLSTTTTYTSGNVDTESRNWCIKYKISTNQCAKEFCKANPNKCKDSNEQIAFDTAMTVAPLLVSFIPVVGPVLGASFGIAEAAILSSEGKNAEAGVVATFSMIPYVGKLISKIPGVKQLGTKGMIELGKKIANKTPLSNSEKIIANTVSKEKNLINQELNTFVKNTALKKLSLEKNSKTKMILKKISEEGFNIAAEETAKKAVGA